MPGNVLHSRKEVLSGITIAVTRPEEQAGKFIKILRNSGAHVIAMPMVRITGPASWKTCDDAIGNLEYFDTVVFTSVNGVKYFMNRLSPPRRKALALKKIFAVGPKTRDAINSYGLNAGVANRDFTGKDMGEALSSLIGKKSSVLFPHGDKGRHELAGMLRQSGIRVTETVVYRNREPEVKEYERFRDMLKNKRIDVFTFFSPSGIGNLKKHLDLPTGSRIAVIGPTTAAAVEKYGLQADIIAEQSTAEKMAEAIIDFYTNKEIRGIKYDG